MTEVEFRATGELGIVEIAFADKDGDDVRYQIPVASAESIWRRLGWAIKDAGGSND